MTSIPYHAFCQKPLTFAHIFSDSIQWFLKLCLIFKKAKTLLNPLIKGRDARLAKGKHG
jgi:hypothetical protein